MLNFCRLKEISNITHLEKERTTSILDLRNIKLSKVTFENNSNSNIVLGIADRIRKLIHLFKDGCHQQEEGHVQDQSCAEIDIEALRRQLRKIRRWQENVTEFTCDDVRDLELITAAIEKHIRSEYQ